ncbi:hypothetical protein KKB44_06110 [Candidatus Micrarchaeota archaeon]|nr:hypothetical protein [Candidatus Micrarchaeota archaeon]
MTSKRLRGPGEDTPEARNAQMLDRLKKRQLRLAIKKAHEKGTQPPKLVTCNPQANGDRTNGRTLDEHLKVIVGPYLIDEAMQEELNGNTFSAIVCLIDKSRQNPVNKLGGKNGGDRAMEAYWDVGATTTMLLGSINGSNRVGMHLTRVSPTSDEGILVIGGTGLPTSTHEQFKQCWAYAREHLDLSKYKYNITIGGEVFELDLKAFSRILKHPDMVVACSYTISSPISVNPLADPRFLMDEIRKLENSEINFYDYLPVSLRGNGGLAEVKTPFERNLFADGIKSKPNGCYIEIKLDIGEIAPELLPLTKDGEWGNGTRKGFAELFSGKGGMRLLNTFIGKARANRILTPIAQALGDLKAMGIDVVPVSGNHLQYWADLPPSRRTKERIREAITRRIHTKVEDVGYLDLEFDPVVTLVKAEGLNVEDVRARFILDSLGRYEEDVAVLDKADFLLNFVENVHQHVQRELYKELSKNGGKGITKEDRENIEFVRYVCASRRTIRDVEDFVWTIRNDQELEHVRDKRDRLENWIFDFAKERFDRMFYLLAQKIRRQVGR